MRVTETHFDPGLAHCVPHDALKGKKPGTCLRVLADVTCGELYRLHTVPIDSGGQCEVLVGLGPRQEAMVFRQFRALPPKEREVLLSGQRRPRVTAPQHVVADVSMAHAAGGPCAPLVFLQTRRGDQVSKLYMGMRPMRADLLGCARNLEDRGAHSDLRSAFTAWVLLQLALQLAHLHAHKIVHRDIRLDNVLCGLDAQGAVCVALADFGNATAGSLTALSRPTGPLPYCAPEVLLGSYAGNWGPRDNPRRDVWSLGIVCLILLLGTNPFDPDCDTRNNTAIADTLQAYSQRGGPQLPPILDRYGVLGDLVRSMLHRDPVFRPTAPRILHGLQASHLLAPERMEAARAFAAEQGDMQGVIESRLRDLRLS